MSEINAVIMGIQGSGKGTQASILSAQYRFTHISTGDIFRSEYVKATPLGLEAYPYWSKGVYVPDKLTISMFGNNLAPNKNLFDGFPRTIPQVQALDDLLSERKSRVTHVIALELSDDEALNRINGRKICTGCATIYGAAKQPLEPDVCDSCKNPLIVREDDTREKALIRIHAHHTKTKPILDLYAARDIVHHINANSPPAQVTANILGVLNL